MEIAARGAPQSIEKLKRAIRIVIGEIPHQLRARVAEEDRR